MLSSGLGRRSFCRDTQVKRTMTQLKQKNAAMRQQVEEPESQSEDEPGQAPRRSGWRGVGPPLVRGSGSATRELHDGAGLCSPCRWPFGKRRLPDNDTLTTARDLIKNFVTQHLSTDLFGKLACGRIENVQRRARRTERRNVPTVSTDRATAQEEEFGRRVSTRIQTPRSCHDHHTQ